MIVLYPQLARYFPKLVLDHVMSIFTFMGDSALRRDDSYSIQVNNSFSKSLQTISYYQLTDYWQLRLLATM